MKRMIPIVDLATGAITDRPSNTLTLDVPQDLDRSAPAELDARSRLQYRTVHGTNAVVTGFTRPLSWRVHGEDCLVSDDGLVGTAQTPGTYKLATVE
jgi:hypothetical protein